MSVNVGVDLAQLEVIQVGGFVAVAAFTVSIQMYISHRDSVNSEFVTI